MNLDKCYARLDLDPGASLDEVKSAFRKRAFDLHPDLHPEDPKASLKFQELNEAYVTLLHHLQKGFAASETSQGKTRTRKASQEYSKQQKTRARSRENTASRQRQGQSRQEDASAEAEHGFRQEEILKNILSDPFARQVFEDIFRAVKRRKPELSKPSFTSEAKRLRLQWGTKRLELDASRFTWSGIKMWLKSQLDHEHTVYVHPGRMLPGTSLSFQITRLGGKPQTIRTTIPPDYQPGRPLRLKGLGRKLGPFAGDLYLRLLPK